MLAFDAQQGLNDAWTRIATFVPKFLGFLVILVLGYLIALVQMFLERRYSLDRETLPKAGSGLVAESDAGLR